MARKAIKVEGGTAVGPYSQAVASGNHLFLSGQTPIDPETGGLKAGSIQDQTEQCFQNLFRVLEAANLTPDDVSVVQVYLTDMADFSAMNEVYEKQFTQPFPARTTIGVAALPLDAKVEIGLTALLRN